MKKLIYAAVFVATAKAGLAQSIEDSVVLGANYANQSFYRLSDGEQSIVNKQSYELVFDVTDQFSTSINLNSSSSAQLWLYPHGGINEWPNVDTNGISSWHNLIDRPESWSLGAFDLTDGTNGLDVGWGMYNTVTHVVTGDSLYVIRTANGDFKNCKSSIWRIIPTTSRYANLDGSNEENVSVNKNDFSGNFAYYSMTNNEVVPAEPTGGWDLLFGQYTAFLPTPYLVSGVFTAPTCRTAEENGVDPNSFVDYSNSNFVEDRNVIGYDWKSFNGSSFDVSSDVVFFVETVNGEVWKIVPLEFEGSSTGKIVFSKEQLSYLNVLEKVGESHTWYPNPAQGSKIFADGLVTGEKVLVYNQFGQLVHQTTSDEIMSRGLSLEKLDNGIYWIQVGSSIQKFNAINNPYKHEKTIYTRSSESVIERNRPFTDPRRSRRHQIHGWELQSNIRICRDLFSNRRLRIS